MSIEEALAKLTGAVEENTKALQSLIAKAAAPVKSDSAKSESKSDGESSGGTGRGRGRPPGSGKAKVPSAADMKTAATEFLEKAGDNEDAYAERKAAVKKIVAKFDAPKFTEIAEEHRAEALKMLAKADEMLSDDGKGDDGEGDEDVV